MHSHDEFEPGLDRVVAAAHRAAVGLGQECLAPEHLLIGIAEVDPSGLPSRVETTELVAVTSKASKKLPTGGRDRDPNDPLPFTATAKRIVKEARKRAKRENRASPNSADLLRLLFGLNQGPLGRVIGRFHLSPDDAEAPMPPAARSGSHNEAAGFPQDLDDDSDLTYVEQLTFQFREAIAAGQLRPGERLLSVRKLADRLGIAPGTVARAYSTLEDEGVLHTDGARGTRVAIKSAEPDPRRMETLIGLMRPVSIAAFHLGASREELRKALEESMKGILKSSEIPSKDHHAQGPSPTVGD